MKYFIVKTDPRFDTAPDITDWFGRIDRRNIRQGQSHKIENRQLLFIQPNPDTCFTDVLSFPFFMVTEELRDVIKQYEPHTLFKEIILLDQKYAKSCIYYLPILEYVDCLADSSELTLDHSTIIKAAVAPDRIGDRSIFYAASVGNLYAIARLDIIESFLRRGAKGLSLEETIIEE